MNECLITVQVRQSEESVLYAEVKRNQSTSQTPPENTGKRPVTKTIKYYIYIYIKYQNICIPYN